MSGRAAALVGGGAFQVLVSGGSMDCRGYEDFLRQCRVGGLRDLLLEPQRSEAIKGFAACSRNS